jgi:hypothetical protein
MLFKTAHIVQTASEGKLFIRMPRNHHCGLLLIFLAIFFAGEKQLANRRREY